MIDNGSHGNLTFDPPLLYAGKNSDKSNSTLNIEQSNIVERAKLFKTVQQAETTLKNVDEHVANKIKFQNPLLMGIELYDPAAKLLVTTVKWLHSVTSFEQISQSEQTSLLQSNWKELFILHAAQYSFYFDEGEFNFILFCLIFH